MNNASVQQQGTAAPGRPVLTPLHTAKVLGLNGEVPESRQTWAARVGPLGLSPQRQHHRSLFVRQSPGSSSQADSFQDRRSAALSEFDGWGRGASLVGVHTEEGVLLEVAPCRGAYGRPSRLGEVAREGQRLTALPLGHTRMRELDGECGGRGEPPRKVFPGLNTSKEKNVQGRAVGPLEPQPAGGNFLKTHPRTQEGFL